MELLHSARIRPAAVRLSKGLLHVTPGDLRKDLYDPFKHRNLPNAFAKINYDERAARRFVQHYGLLGFYELATPSQRCGGEPLDWIYAHADSVHFALDIIGGLKDKKSKDKKRVDLRQVLEARQQPAYGMKPWMNAIDGVHAGYDLAIGVTSPYSRLYPLPLQNPPARQVWDSDQDIIRQHARAVLSLLVNRNTSNVRLQLYSTTEALEVHHRFDTLIEAIWYLVGIMAAGLQSSSKIDIRLCDNCHLPFVATDGRQRFCPPWYSEESQCAVAHRARVHRQNPKKEGKL